MFNRLTVSVQRVAHCWTSTFWNPAKLSLYRILRSCSPLTLPDGAFPPKWLEHIYRTAHPALRWLRTKLAEQIGETHRRSWGFQIKPIRELSLDPAGLLPSSTVSESCMSMHVASGELITFSCMEWQSQRFRRTICAAVCPLFSVWHAKETFSWLQSKGMQIYFGC